MKIVYLLLFLTLALFSQAITSDLEYQKVTSVNYTWKHVNFQNNYSDAIVVCSNVLPSSNHNEAVVRIQNISSNGFDVKIQQPNDSDAGYSTDVYCIISDEGSYSIPFKYEAHKVLSTSTSGQYTTDRWNAIGTQDVSNAMVQTYTKPAVLGQVMSYNDNRFSTFWSFDCDARSNRPFQSGMADGICVGKHIGQIAESRADETLGYIVAEAGVYELEDFSMAIDYGSDSIKGVGDSPAYTYALDKSYTHGVATQEAMDGVNGGWAVLYGLAPIGSSLNLAIDEETVASDTTRKHTTENVAYWVFLYDPVDLAEMKINEVLYQETSGNINEFIEFYVTKSGDLKNYLFTDQDGISHHYRFPKHSVSLGDYVVLHIGSGSNSVVGNVHHFYMGSSSVFINNTGGDDILLLKPSNTDVTMVDGRATSTVPFDYIAYGTNGGIDVVPTSLNGITLSWNASEGSRMIGANDGESISLTPNAIDGDTSVCWEITATTDANKKASNCPNYIPTRNTSSSATLTYSLGESNTASPDIKLTKTSVTIYDPINISSNPKAIPGAVVKYVIELKNEGLGSTDNESVILQDNIPSSMKVCVGTVANCQSINLVEGVTVSGLSLGTLSYSDDGGSTFSYSPTADSEGYDSSVTDVRFLLDGAFSASDGTNHPSATIQIYMGLK